MSVKRDSLVSTRWSLVKRLKEWGDDESWEDFFDSYWKLIYSVALRAGCTASEAEEVVQETVLSVAKAIRQFKADPAIGSFRGWLCSITRRRIADQLRKRPPVRLFTERRRTATTDRVSDNAKSGLEADWDKEWRSHLMELALDRIKARANARQYQIFNLYVMKGQPAERVARGLGVKVADVYLAKHRIAAQVKKEIKRLEVELI